MSDPRGALPQEDGGQQALVTDVALTTEDGWLEHLGLVEGVSRCAVGLVCRHGIPPYVLGGRP